MPLQTEFNNAQFTEYFSTFLNNGGSIPSVLDSMPEDDNGLSFAERFTHRNYYKEIGSETEELFNMHLQIKCEEVVNRYKWKLEEYQAYRDKLIMQYVEVNNLQTDTYGGTDTLTRNDTDGGSESKTKSATKTGTHGLTRADKETGTEDNDITNIEYYNPVNVSSDNVVGKNTNEKDLAYGRSFSRSDNETNSDTENGTDETTFGKTFDRTDKTQYGKTLTREYIRQIPVVFKDVPSIMKATFDLQVLYEEAFKLIEDEWYEIVEANFDFEGTDFAEYGSHIYFTGDLDDNGVPFDESDYDINYEPEIRHFEDKLFAAGLISKKLGKSA